MASNNLGSTGKLRPSGGKGDAIGCDASGSWLVHDKCHLEHHPILGNLAIFNLDFLFLNPGTLDVLYRLGCLLNTAYDGILKAVGGFGGYLDDLGDTGFSHCDTPFLMHVVKGQIRSFMSSGSVGRPRLPHCSVISRFCNTPFARPISDRGMNNML